MIRVPLTASGWPIAMAPPFTFRVFGSIPSSFCTAKACGAEELVHFDEVDVAEFLARAFQRFSDGRRGAYPHDRGIAAHHSIRNQSAQRLFSLLLRKRLGRHHHSSRAIHDSPLALPAVTTPSFLKRGFSFAKPSSVASARGCSSFVSSMTAPFRSFTGNGTISSPKLPRARASAAFFWLMSEN